MRARARVCSAGVPHGEPRIREKQSHSRCRGLRLRAAVYQMRRTDFVIKPKKEWSLLHTCRNVQAVFGPRRKLWCLPIKRCGLVPTAAPVWVLRAIGMRVG